LEDGKEGSQCATEEYDIEARANGSVKDGFEGIQVGKDRVEKRIVGL
jgi:hypothetical protein